MDDHPVVNYLKKVWLVDDDAQITDEHIFANMAQNDPVERSKAFGKIEAWYEDGNSTLRQRAQLLDLQRRMRSIDTAMRKAGR